MTHRINYSAYNYSRIIIFLEPGHLQFEKRGYLVKESCGNAEIGVLRQNGADGNIGAKWRTIDKSAVNGKDYVGGEGEIKFKHGEVNNTNYLMFLYVKSNIFQCIETHIFLLKY